MQGWRGQLQSAQGIRGDPGQGTPQARPTATRGGPVGVPSYDCRLSLGRGHFTYFPTAYGAVGEVTSIRSGRVSAEPEEPALGTHTVAGAQPWGQTGVLPLHSCRTLGWLPLRVPGSSRGGWEERSWQNERDSGGWYRQTQISAGWKPVKSAGVPDQLGSPAEQVMGNCSCSYHVATTGGQPSFLVPSCLCESSRSVVSDSLQPVDCSPPGSSVHGIFQAKILEWIAISFSRGSSRSKDQIQVSCTAGRLFTI